MTNVNDPCGRLSNIFTGAEKHIGTVAAPVTQPPSSFTVVDDRVVFDDGITKRWRIRDAPGWRK